MALFIFRSTVRERLTNIVKAVPPTNRGCGQNSFALVSASLHSFLFPACSLGNCSIGSIDQTKTPRGNLIMANNQSQGGGSQSGSSRSGGGNDEQRREAARKGGEAVSEDREHMSEIGRKGGEASGGGRSGGKGQGEGQGGGQS
jgi:uncharacterized protein